MKKAMSLILTLILLFLFTIPFAAANENASPEMTTYQDVSPRWEHTTTYLRVRPPCCADCPPGGVLEYRIWSNTFGRWNTPWRPVFP